MFHVCYAGHTDATRCRTHGVCSPATLCCGRGVREGVRVSGYLPAYVHADVCHVQPCTSPHPESLLAGVTPAVAHVRLPFFQPTFPVV